MKNSPVASRHSFITRHLMLFVTIAVVVAYACFVEWMWGWQTIIASWREAGFWPVFLAILLLLSTYVLRTWRIHDYFPTETKGYFGALFRLAQVHNLLNIMLPFRTGETSFPLLMKAQFQVPLARGTSALLVMRLLDLHALLAAAAAGLAVDMARGWIWLLWTGFFLLPVAGFAIRGRVFRYAAAITPARMWGLLDGLQAGLPVDSRAFAKAWLATALNWFVKVAVLAWALILLGVSPLGAGFGGALGGELSSVLPVHAPGGVGTYPAGIAAGALAFGASTARDAVDALGRAAVNIHLLVVVSSLAGTALSLVFGRKSSAA